MRQAISIGTILLLIALALLGVVRLIAHIGPLLILILIAIVLATGIEPMVHRLQKGWKKWRMPRALATAIVLLTGVMVLLGAMSLLLVTAIQEAISFARFIWPEMQANLLAWAQNLSARYPFMPNLDSLWDQVQGQSGRLSSYLWSTTRTVFGVLGGLFSLVTILILTFFFSISKDGITQTFTSLIPPSAQSTILTVTHRAAQRMGGWLRGQLLLALIITITTIAGMALLGVPYAVLIGIVGGVGELLPMVGPYLAAVPAILIVFATGAALWKIILVLIFFAILSQVENYILSPKIMERHVELAPITTILALLIGGSLLGLVGALLAIPLAAAGRVLLLELIVPAIQRSGRSGCA
jgi:predicted PurR-regulated permease PerM